MMRDIKTLIQIILEKIFNPLRIVLIHYNYPSKFGVFDTCRQLRSESKTLLSVHELYNLYKIASSTLLLHGAMAEVGVYKGGSAKLLCLLKSNKRLYLFDTFMGLPNGTNKDDNFHKNNRGIYCENIKNVQVYLKKYKNVTIKQELFPDSAKSLKKCKFSFVHLDVDLYEGTINSLNYFWNRMSNGGVIIVHDYPVLDGVKNAILDFCKEKQIVPIEIPPSQVVIIKI